VQRTRNLVIKRSSKFRPSSDGGSPRPCLPAPLSPCSTGDVMATITLLILIALHIASGIVAAACGAGAMFTRKGSSRHLRFGRAYMIVLVLLCGTATILASLDWAHRWHLAVLGAVALSCAAVGYSAVRQARPDHIAVHLSGTGVGYIAMLTAFYVDNGPRLPLWNLLLPLWLWLLPAAIGVPIIVRAVVRIVRTSPRRWSGATQLRPLRRQ
jgi:hypothetical protein